MEPPSLRPLEEALSGVERLAIDSAPIIYFIEENPRYLALVEVVFERIAAGSLTAVTSAITLTEVLTLRQGRHEIADSYTELLLGAEHFSTVSLDAAIGAAAAELRARHGIRTPDALQIACAIAAGCDAFLTNDKDLRRLNEIPIVVLDELLEGESSGS